MAPTIPFVKEFDYEYGRVQELSPKIRRIIAENPGPFTFTGTGTYIIGRGNVAVIDPGPLDEAHLQNIHSALAGERITHILITHTHMDHSPAAGPLKEATGATTYGFGPHGSGISNQDVTTETGGDREFDPDIRVSDGDIIEGDGWTMECVYTPGHTSNHICYALKEEKILFTGDHVMGWSTSIVGPPDGNMTRYIASLEKLLERDDEGYWPTHGPKITNPKDFVRAYIQHRVERENQIKDCLNQGIDRIKKMVPVMYDDIDERLIPAAAISVYAQIERMIDLGVVGSDDPSPHVDSRYFLK